MTWKKKQRRSGSFGGQKRKNKRETKRENTRGEMDEEPAEKQ